ncbi:hypothetical protein ACWEP4_36030 [Streptomyces sp. NPDC004227]
MHGLFPEVQPRAEEFAHGRGLLRRPGSLASGRFESFAAEDFFVGAVVDRSLGGKGWAGLQAVGEVFEEVPRVQQQSCRDRATARVLDPPPYGAQIESAFALPDELPAVAITVFLQRLEVMERKEPSDFVNDEIIGGIVPSGPPDQRQVASPGRDWVRIIISRGLPGAAAALATWVIRTAVIVVR